MKERKWYEERLEAYDSGQKDIIRLLLDIRDLLTSFSARMQQKFEEEAEKQ